MYVAVRYYTNGITSRMMMNTEHISGLDLDSRIVRMSNGLAYILTHESFKGLLEVLGVDAPGRVE